MYRVRIVSGDKHNIVDRKHTIPAANEDEAAEWGRKQAAELGLDDAIVTVKEWTNETPSDVAAVGSTA